MGFDDYLRNLSEMVNELADAIEDGDESTQQIVMYHMNLDRLLEYLNGGEV